MPSSCQDHRAPTAYSLWCVAQRPAIAGGPHTQASHARVTGRESAWRAGARRGVVGNRRRGQAPSTDWDGAGRQRGQRGEKERRDTVKNERRATTGSRDAVSCSSTIVLMQHRRRTWCDAHRQRTKEHTYATQSIPQDDAPISHSVLCCPPGTHTSGRSLWWWRWRWACRAKRSACPIRHSACPIRHSACPIRHSACPTNATAAPPGDAPSARHVHARRHDGHAPIFSYQHAAARRPSAHRRGKQCLLVWRSVCGRVQCRTV